MFRSRCGGGNPVAPVFFEEVLNIVLEQLRLDDIALRKSWSALPPQTSLSSNLVLRFFSDSLVAADRGYPENVKLVRLQEDQDGLLVARARPTTRFHFQRSIGSPETLLGNL